jgi:hypothetical protein
MPTARQSVQWVTTQAAKPRAWVLMLVAVILYILARWAHNEPAVTLPVVMSGTFAIFVIALLDHGGPAVIARGLAWLFILGAAYQAIPAVTGAIQSAKTAAPAAKPGSSGATAA